MMQSQVAELKQQGALEAARDSNSKVTAEDAERKIVEETRKAGLQAYQFDADASPAEKAAQARSVGHSPWSRAVHVDVGRRLNHGRRTSLPGSTIRESRMRRVS